jgi:hypothetical protein
VRLAQHCSALSAEELDALVQEARTVVQNDTLSKCSPIFWLYDLKTLAWQKESEPATVAY